MGGTVRPVYYGGDDMNEVHIAKLKLSDRRYIFIRMAARLPDGVLSEMRSALGVSHIVTDEEFDESIDARIAFLNKKYSKGPREI